MKLHLLSRDEFCLTVHTEHTQSIFERIECMQSMVQFALQNTAVDVTDDEYADAIAMYIETLSFDQRITLQETVSNLDVHECSKEQNANILLLQQVLRNAIILATCERFTQRLQVLNSEIHPVHVNEITASVNGARSRYILNPARPTIAQ
jgi:hypothetical protein